MQTGRRAPRRYVPVDEHAEHAYVRAIRTSRNADAPIDIIELDNGALLAVDADSVTAYRSRADLDADQPAATLARPASALATPAAAIATPAAALPPGVAPRRPAWGPCP